MQQTISTVHVLLADDDPDDVALFEEALSEIPVSVVLNRCENGIELMEILQTSAAEALPHIIFLDLNMPKKTGFECIKEIRQYDTLKHIPVVIISTSFDREIIHLLYQQGANRYLLKPNNFGHLKSLINHILDLNARQGLHLLHEKDFILQP